jgi:hypothetical protein
MEGALDRSGAGSLTRARGRRSWFSQAGSATSRTARECDRGRQRRVVSLARGRERRGDAAPPDGGARSARSKRVDDRDDVTEAEVGPSSLAQPRSDCRKVVRRRCLKYRALVPWHGRRSWGEGQRGASRALGNRAIYECSCRKAVADVGEKHLVRESRGAERRTERERASAGRRLHTR